MKLPPGVDLEIKRKTKPTGECRLLAIQGLDGCLAFPYRIRNLPQD